jgi:signal transduction histidine kinase
MAFAFSGGTQLVTAAQGNLIAVLLTATFACQVVFGALFIRRQISDSADRSLRNKDTQKTFAGVVFSVALAITVAFAIFGNRSFLPPSSNTLGSLTGQAVFTTSFYASVMLAFLFKAKVVVPFAILMALLVHGIETSPLGSSANNQMLLSLLTFSACIAGLVGVRVEMWYLRVMEELEASRIAGAKLAVAEERLRYSRDLHDTLGQALSAIAVKSELAAELAKRGRNEQAITEILAVRALAQETQAEARGVVAGLRNSDLATEIVSARSLLAAAGVNVSVVGNPAVVPEQFKETLAWVLREAVTNIVRHSQASNTTFNIGTSGPETVLKITNDGVKAPLVDASPLKNGKSGTGLIGLRERLAVVGGTLTTKRDGETFALEARVGSLT